MSDITDQPTTVLPIITDPEEVRRTLESLPVITPDMALCPTCWTPLQWLQGARMWRCDGCKVLLTPATVAGAQGAL